MQRQSAVDQFDDVQEKIPLAVYVVHMCCVLSLTADLLWERPSFESTGEIQEFCWQRERILQQNSLAQHWARDWRALALTQENTREKRRKEYTSPSAFRLLFQCMWLLRTCIPGGGLLTGVCDEE